MNTSLAGIRNLLFDLGGVIINLDRQRCVDVLTALGDEKGRNAGPIRPTGNTHGFGRGKIIPKRLFQVHAPKDRKAVSDEEIVHALNELF